ncbi:MAG: hypothetical protein P1U43_11930, partial [Maricaulis sp.]|nr:hypothetical protein [Maricaulis sp.]
MAGKIRGKRLPGSGNKLAMIAATSAGMLALSAAAQADGVSSIPDGFLRASDIPGIASIRLLADGSVELVLEDGSHLWIEASDVIIHGDAVFVSQTALAEAVDAQADGTPGGGGLAVLAALAGGGLAVGAGGSSSPNDAPPPNAAPVFTSSASASVGENQASAFTAAASDADGDGVTYALSGTDAALFAIDASTGVVTFLTAPDYEAPADGDGDNVYDLVVTASDGTNTTDQAVIVTVTNENDNVPAFTSGRSVSFEENATGPAYTAAASDADGDAVTYALSGVDAALFVIDADTGAISFLTAPDYEAPADGDGDNVYDLVVTASDGTHTTDQAVAITVTNENDNAPAVTSGGSASFVENAIGIAYTAEATDQDGDGVTYALSGTDAALFVIDASTGVVTFRTAPDYEAPADGNGDNVYDLVVTVSDGTNATDQAVAITVTNLNDNSPVFSSGASASFAEAGTGVVYAATATDADGDTLTYSLSGTDAALFGIDASTGELRFLAPPDFETPADADADNAYQIIITASDGTTSSDQAVTVSVTDVETIVVSGSDEADFIDTSGNDEPTQVSAGAGDDGIKTGGGNDIIDGGEGDDIIVAGGGADAVDGGAGDDTLVIIGQTRAGEYDDQALTNSGGQGLDLSGVLSADNVNGNAADDAQPGERLIGGAGYDTVVVYGRSDLSTTTIEGVERLVLNSEITLDIADIGPGGIETIAGDGTSILRLTGSGTLSLSDFTLTGVVFLELAAGVTLSAADAAALTATGLIVIGGAGTLQVDTLAGGELAGFTIAGGLMVTSGPGGSTPINPIDFGATVTADAVDEVILTSGASGSIAEGASGAVYTASALDADGDTASYSLSGADAALFDIDGTTGVVTFKVAPDYETPGDTGGDNVYDLVVTASDGTNTTDQAVTIAVTNVNDNSPVFSSGASASFAENGRGAIYVAAAGDADGDAVSYSLSGTDAALFDLDRITGVVTFKVAPDYETPGDVGGDNVYDVVVTASDGSNTADQAVTITVTDVFEQTIIGTTGNDTLDGTSGADEIYGRGGNDTIRGQAGNDRIFGEDGNDNLEGGLGDDYVDGGAGRDLLGYRYSTSSGDDTLLGGSGDDHIYVSINSAIAAPSITINAGADNDLLTLENYHASAVVIADMGSGDDEIGFYGGRAGAVFSVDLGSGDDFIRFGSGGVAGLGDFALTLGAGRDVIELQALPENLSVSDFEVGASGDVIRLNIASTLTNWDGSDNPFATGHFRLVQQGADTVVQVDTDGGGDSWATLLTLDGVTATDLSAENFDGFDPD